MQPLTHPPGDPVPTDLIEARIPWPRDRFWRPGEPITLEIDGATVTFRLRGVMRDPDPRSAFATVRLQPMRTVTSARREPRSRRSAAG
jgi:hypothetical protein